MAYNPTRPHIWTTWPVISWIRPKLLAWVDPLIGYRPSPEAQRELASASPIVRDQKLIRHEQESILLNVALPVILLFEWPFRIFGLRPIFLTSVASALADHMALTCSPRLAETALRIAERALNLPYPWWYKYDWNKMRTHTLMGHILELRYRHVSGSASDMHTSVAHHNAAVRGSPPYGPARDQSHLGAARAYATRFESLGSASDLQFAISLVSTPHGVDLHSWLNQSAVLALLSRVYQLQYELGEDESTLSAAIQYAKASLSVQRPLKMHTQAAERISTLRRLVDLSVARAHHANAGTDEAGQFSEHLMAEIQRIGGTVAHLNAVESYYSTANVMRHRHIREVDAALKSYYLEAASWYTTTAISLCEQTDPRMCRLEVLLAEVELLVTPEASPDKVISLLERAASRQEAPPSDRLTAAFEWLRLAMESDHPSLPSSSAKTFELVEICVANLPTLSNQRLSMRVRTAVRRACEDLPRLANEAIKRGYLKLAVELLDRGRCIILGSLGRYRSPLDELQATHPDLAEKFADLSRQLEEVVTWDWDQPRMNDSHRKNLHQDSLQQLQPTDWDEGGRHQMARKQWEETVVEIRSCAGFSNFLQPPTFSDLQAATKSGPVILLNVAQSVDAIIVRPDGDPIRIALEDDGDAIRTILGMFYSSQEDGELTAILDDDRQLRKALLRLGEIVVSPVANVLAHFLEPHKNHRVWWCPTSFTSFLPLHAADVEPTASSSKQKKRRKQRFCDLYISSYIPTISMLLQASNRRTVASGHISISRKALVIAVTNAPGLPPLPGVQKELEAIESVLTSSITLKDEAASKDSVLEHLRSSAWVHFACHGVQCSDDPLQSHFKLAQEDKPLRLLDLMHHNLHHSELAVLLTCHSAAGDRTIPDEAFNLTSGMMFAGFQGVIGALWPTNDAIGEELARDIYKHLATSDGNLGDSIDAALALHEAVNAVRRRKRDPEDPLWLSHWIQFVHYGL
ncbi:hypothetical protein AB1N83_007242 [Pleurotus pulmonarius]